MNPTLEDSLKRLLSNAKARVSPQTERGGLCRCGSYWSPKVQREVTVGWVFVSTEGHGTVRPCESCRRVSPVAVAPERESSFQ